MTTRTFAGTLGIDSGQLGHIQISGSKYVVTRMHVHLPDVAWPGEESSPGAERDSGAERKSHARYEQVPTGLRCQSKEQGL